MQAHNAYMISKLLSISVKINFTVLITISVPRCTLRKWEYMYRIGKWGNTVEALSECLVFTHMFEDRFPRRRNCQTLSN